MERLKRLLILRVTLFAAIVSTGFLIFGLSELRPMFAMISGFNWFNLMFLYSLHMKIEKQNNDKVKVKDLYPED